MVLALAGTLVLFWRAKPASDGQELLGGQPERGPALVDPERPPSDGQRSLPTTPSSTSAELARAEIEVILTRVPDAAGPLEAVWIRVDVGLGYAGEAVAVERHGDTGRALLAVPAEAALQLLVRAEGLRVSTGDERIVLKAGERRRISLDLGAGCEIEGRLVGVPEPGQLKVLLEHCGWEWGGAGLEPLPMPLGLESRTDADGGFRFHQVPGRSVGFALWTARGPIALVERGTRAASWSACDAHFIELEPAEPLVGLVPVDEGGARLTAEPFAVLLEGEPSFEPRSFPGGVALVSLRALLESKGVGIFAPERGLFRFPASEPPPLAGTLLELRLAPDAVPRGGIFIDVGEPVPAELDVDFLRHGPEGPQRLLGMQILHSRRGLGWPVVERHATGIALRRLPEGRYDLHWLFGRGGRRLLRADVDVVEGAERVVEAALPRLREREIRVARWEEIPVGMRPVRVWIDQLGEYVRDGSLRIPVLEPLPTQAWVQGPPTFVWSRPLALTEGEAGELMLECPFEELDRIEFQVPARFGGRILAQLDLAWREPPPLGTSVALDAVTAVDGRLELVVERDVPRTGVVREHAGKSRVLRGWLAVGAGKLPGAEAFEGRFVRIRFTRPDRLVELALEGPDLGGASRKPDAIAQLDSTNSTSVWIPDATRALWIRPRGGVPRRVPYSPGQGDLELE